MQLTHKLPNSSNPGASRSPCCNVRCTCALIPTTPHQSLAAAHSLSLHRSNTQTVEVLRGLAP